MTTDRGAAALVAVDDDTLAALIQAAVTAADAGEVTPPVTAGDHWTSGRISWLQAFHRDRRSGLSGPLGEATWAVVVAGSVVGSVRLRRLAGPGPERGGIERPGRQSRDFACGAWLVRYVRGRGVGSAALALVLEQARSVGASRVRADTGADNPAALRALQRSGFVLQPGLDGRVAAVLGLPGPAGS